MLHKTISKSFLAWRSSSLSRLLTYGAVWEGPSQPWRRGGRRGVNCSGSTRNYWSLCFFSSSSFRLAALPITGCFQERFQRAREVCCPRPNVWLLRGLQFLFSTLLCDPGSRRIEWLQRKQRLQRSQIITQAADLSWVLSACQAVSWRYGTSSSFYPLNSCMRQRQLSSVYSEGTEGQRDEVTRSRWAQLIWWNQCLLDSFSASKPDPWTRASLHLGKPQSPCLPVCLLLPSAGKKGQPQGKGLSLTGPLALVHVDSLLFILLKYRTETSSYFSTWK